MRYTVSLTPTAKNDLAEAWLKASDRSAVTRASHRIEQELRRRADVAGETIGSFRRFVEPPLEVMYKILPDGVRVRIYRFDLIG